MYRKCKVSVLVLVAPVTLVRRCGPDDRDPFAKPVSKWDFLQVGGRSVSQVTLLYHRRQAEGSLVGVLPSSVCPAGDEPVELRVLSSKGPDWEPAAAGRRTASHVVFSPICS